MHAFINAVQIFAILGTMLAVPYLIASIVYRVVAFFDSTMREAHKFEAHKFEAHKFEAHKFEAPRVQARVIGIVRRDFEADSIVDAILARESFDFGDETAERTVDRMLSRHGF